MDYNGFEYIDLGLSVCWATCNVGAEKPTESGLYFQWGDIRGYNELELKNLQNEIKYKFKEDNSNWHDSWNYTKYGIDRNNRLDLVDDAANFHMGGKWRMPTWDECKELADACLREKEEDVCNFFLIGESSINLSFPKCNYRTASSSLKNVANGSWWIWTNELSNSGDIAYALPFRVPDEVNYKCGLRRACALNIRGVFSKD